MTTDGVLGAAYLPTDGYIDPSQLTFALAEGARRRGAEINTNTRVTAIGVERGRVTGVETDKGSIETEIVINAGGMFAREIGALAGVEVPVIPMAHEYLVTRPHGRPARRPDDARPEPPRLLPRRVRRARHGRLRARPAPWSLDGIPADFNGKLLPEDWERFEELMTNAIVRVPALENAEVVKLINGPEAFTPDGEFILGESDVRGFWVAAGFCAHGLAGAGGMGQLMAEWIVDGQPGLDTWEMDSRRFGAALPQPRVHARAHGRGLRDLLRRQVPGPGAPRRTAAAGLPRLRAARRARRLLRGEVGLGARELVRVERGRRGRVAPPARLGREDLVARDRRRAPRLPRVRGALRRDLVREARRHRRRARPSSSRASAPTASRATSARSRTRRCSIAKGGIECDFTVTRLAEERFRIVTGTAFGRHDLAWIRSHLPDDGAVQLEDVTSRFACFGLWGPAAREILQPLTDADLSFPYMRARELVVGPVPCLAVRVTYVGELGWELYCPVRVRAAPVGPPLGGRRRARARRRRLQGDRLAAPGEGLPRLGRRHLPGGHAVRGRARLRGQAGQGRVHRARGARGRARAGAAARLHRARRSRARSRSAPSRCGSTARSRAG